MNDTDEALIARYYGCENAAMDELFRHHSPRLTMFFKLQAKQLSAHDAEEWTQEVFVRVMNTKFHLFGKSAVRYDGARGASFRTWLFTIATNIFLDASRKKKRRPSIDFTDLAAKGDEGETVPFETTIASKNEPTAEDVVLARDLRKQVHDCMARLPDRERLVIDLYKMKEMTLEQVGAVLGISAPQTWRVMKKALELMRQCLEGEQKESHP